MKVNLTVYFNKSFYIHITEERNHSVVIMGQGCLNFFDMLNEMLQKRNVMVRPFKGTMHHSLLKKLNRKK